MRTLALSEMQGLILSFMACRRSVLEKGDGQRCMEKNFPCRTILRCLMKKPVIIIWPCAMSLLVFLEKGQSWHMSHPLIKQQAFVFQHSFSGTASGLENFLATVQLHGPQPQRD